MQNPICESSRVVESRELIPALKEIPVAESGATDKEIPIVEQGSRRRRRAGQHLKELVESSLPKLDNQNVASVIAQKQATPYKSKLRSQKSVS